MLLSIRAWMITYWGGVHRYFGISNRSQRDFELAVRYYRRALAFAPDYRPARIALAKLLGREMGAPEEGIQELNRLLHKNPKDGDALFTRAQFRQELAQFSAAEVDLETFLTLPDSKYTDSAARQLSMLRAIQPNQSSGSTS